VSGSIFGDAETVKTLNDPKANICQGWFEWLSQSKESRAEGIDQSKVRVD